jgi:hypothetical protein
MHSVSSVVVAMTVTDDWHCRRTVLVCLVVDNMLQDGGQSVCTTMAGALAPSGSPYLANLRAIRLQLFSTLEEWML